MAYSLLDPARDLGLLPGRTPDGGPFRSEAFPLEDGTPGSIHMQAVPVAGGYALMRVVERSEGGKPTVTQTLASPRVRGLEDQARGLIGFEHLERMRDRTPVPGGDAATVGPTHVRAFLLQRGLVVDAEGEIHRANGQGGASGLVGRFQTRDLQEAAAAPMHLPAAEDSVEAAPHEALPVAVPALRPDPSLGLEPWLDRSVIGARGLRSGLPLLDGFALSRRTKNLRSAFDAIRDNLQPGDSGTAIHIMLRALRVPGHDLDPGRLAVLALEALNVGNARVAMAALHSGADFGALSHPDLHYLIRAENLSGLGSAARPGQLAGLLAAGLPATGRVADLLLDAALRRGDTEALDLFQQHRDVVAFAQTRDSVLGAIRNPKTLEWMLDNGFDASQPELSVLKASVPELLAQYDAAASLALLQRRGLPIAGSRGQPALSEALEHRSTDAAKHLIATEFPTLEPQMRARLTMQAAERYQDELVVRMLAADPASAEGLAWGNGLHSLRIHYLPLAEAALAADPAAMTPLVKALLHKPGTSELDVLPRLLATGSPGALAAAAANAGRLQDFLLQPGWDAAAAALLRQPGPAANIVLRGLTHEGDGCPVAAAVARGKPELVSALLEAGTLPAAPAPGAAPLLSRAIAGRTDLKTLEALATGLPPAMLNAIGADGDTALLVAAKARDTERLRVLLDAGADAGIADRSGRIAADYASPAAQQIIARAQNRLALSA